MRVALLAIALFLEASVVAFHLPAGARVPAVATVRTAHVPLRPAVAMVVEEKEKVEAKEGEEQDETKNLLQKVKDAGVAGAISYAAWELGFWGISVPVCVFGYREVTGHWPDFSNQDDLAKLGAEAFAFVNLARFAVPLRIGLALSTTPWVQSNVVDKFINKKEE